MSLNNKLEKVDALERSEKLGSVRYDLSLAFEKNSKSYNVHTTIKFELNQDWEAPWLDLIALSILTLKVNGKQVHERWNRKRLNLPSLKKGEHQLEIHCKVPLYHNGVGMHSYTDPQDSREYLFSNLCPYDAHRIFPCFDQPDLKATFDVRVKAPASWHVIANSAVKKVDSSSQLFHSWTFERSPKMSTYLFALCLGEYEKISPDFDTSIPMDIYVRKPLAEHVDAKRIFTTIEKGVSFYSEAFSTPYPFGKYDQVFVPEFNWGAMENIGCVVLREGYIYEHEPSKNELYSRANTLVHELAHQWFGNLVTMRWWDDLWLNEAFATLVAYLCLERTGLYLDSFQYFSDEVKLEAIEEDQYLTTHPVVVQCADTDQAFQNFDAITYLKGASVLYQLFYHVGEDNFKEGLKHYFANHAFDNASLDDFLGCFQNVDLSQWSKAWLENTGVNSVRQIRRKNQLQLNQECEDGIFRERTFCLQTYKKKEGSLVLHSEESVDLSHQSLTIESAHDDSLAFYSNGHDYDYAKTILDPVSLEVFCSSLASLEDEYSRSLIFHAIYNMVYELECDPLMFYELALSLCEAEPNSVLAHSAVSKVREFMDLGLLGDRKGSFRDSLKSWVDFNNPESSSTLFLEWLGLAQQEDVEKLSALLAQGVADSRVRFHIAYQICKLDDSEYARNALALLEEDQSQTGVTRSFRALCANSRGDQRDELFERLLTDKKSSVSFLAEGMTGFFHPHREHQPYLDKYFQNATEIASQRDATFIKNYFLRFFPAQFHEESLEGVNFLLSRDIPPTMQRHLLHWKSSLERKIRLKNKF